ncbi:uncharacterized protein BKA78DRAFT_170875 [Phyllosticta capitalensis]|uniref:uncharacterized protein n=1 Tax=Phyllosticta capitalensis TaxID=121624 RepID=UPI0031302E75
MSRWPSPQREDVDLKSRMKWKIALDSGLQREMATGFAAPCASVRSHHSHQQRSHKANDLIPCPTSCLTPLISLFILILLWKTAQRYAGPPAKRVPRKHSLNLQLFASTSGLLSWFKSSCKGLSVNPEANNLEHDEGSTQAAHTSAIHGRAENFEGPRRQPTAATRIFWSVGRSRLSKLFLVFLLHDSLWTMYIQERRRLMAWSSLVWCDAFVCQVAQTLAATERQC